MRRWTLGADAPMTAASVTNLKQVAANIASTWNPTGFFTPTQLSDVMVQFHKIYLAVSRVAEGYLAQPLTLAKSTAADLRDKMLRARNQFINKYNQALAAAAAQHKLYIDAPGLKAESVAFLYEMDRLLTGMGVLMLANDVVWNSIPGAREVLATCVGAANVIRAIAGVAIEVVKAAGNAVLAIPDTVGTIITVLKWGALVYGGVWVYGELRRAER